MAKVVLVDNFDRDTVADMLYKENIATTEEAQAIADEYNKDKPEMHCWFAVVRDDNYRLYNPYE